MMLRFSTKAMWRRAGLFLAVLYLACVIGPPLAWAFSDGTVAAHCLADDHHHVAAMAQVAAQATTHVHADGSAHHHADHSQAPAPAHHDDSHGKGAPAQCCGLFCVSAMTGHARLPIGVSSRAMAIAPGLQAEPAGLEPPRIDRPPNLLASL
jgi:hypothetical protein